MILLIRKVNFLTHDGTSHKTPKIPLLIYMWVDLHQFLGGGSALSIKIN